MDCNALEGVRFARPERRGVLEPWHYFVANGGRTALCGRLAGREWCSPLVSTPAGCVLCRRCRMKYLILTRRGQKRAIAQDAREATATLRVIRDANGDTRCVPLAMPTTNPWRDPDDIRGRL